ncbi:hypothetical protein C8R43DRAFT_1017695 [Mycena crocata]|nr:hypothetical protein C8R43DRAFT_1017622 [Mycena crocata]KAJ7140176.1 hypothetical protein C8R43DRAFT_1017695 [Mycena crocata]
MSSRTARKDARSSSSRSRSPRPKGFCTDHTGSSSPGLSNVGAAPSVGRCEHMFGRCGKVTVGVPVSRAGADFRAACCFVEALHLVQLSDGRGPLVGRGRWLYANLGDRELIQVECRRVRVRGYENPVVFQRGVCECSPGARWSIPCAAQRIVSHPI